MPTYPDLKSIRPEGLVPLEAQPTYLPLPGVEYGETVNISAELVDRHVAAGRADDIAIFFADEGTTFTFGELEAQSQALAGVLIALGLETGDRVGIRFPNRPEATIAMLAVWRAGGAVLPVPPQARAAELPSYIDDVDARFLIVYERDPGIDEVITATKGLAVEHVIAGPTAGDTPFLSWADLVADADPLVEPVAVPADLPSVFWHTGGTTGKPKCCYHTAAQFLLAGKSAGQAYGVEDTDLHMAFPGPVGHAAGLLGRTNISLLNGVPFVEVERMGDPKALLIALSEYGVTWVTGVAPLWAGMLKAYRADPDAYDLSKLRKVFAPMISAVSEEIYDGWVELGLPLQNTMGSTQFATWFLVPPPLGSTPPGSVGPPAPGYEATIIDAEKPGFHPVATDEIGLLAVRGPSGLTYWNRPEMQERDVRDGWTVMDDLARMDDKGYVWYLGRSDFMISTSGFKVAPVEVEEAMVHHPAVAEVSVVGSPDPERGEVVTAFVVPQAGATANEDTAKDIQDFVKRQISPYKYPRRIVWVDSLPRDLVGKVQIRDLREQAKGIPFGEHRSVTLPS